MLPEQHRCVQRSPRYRNLVFLWNPQNTNMSKSQFMLPVAAPCRHYLHSGPLEGGPMSYRLEMFSQKQTFNDIFLIKQDTLILLLTCHEIGVEKMVGRVLFSHGIQESKLIDEPTSECFRV